MKYVFFIFILSTTLFFNTAYGQTYQEQVQELLKPTIEFQLTPETPGPNEFVTVKILSSGTDLNRNRITWILDGVEKVSKIGETTFSFKTKNYGQTSVVRFIVNTDNKMTVDKSLSVRPADVDLVWEAEGYAPPFYKGKAVFSYQNQINFIAIPHITGSNGVQIPTKNLVYKWKDGGKVIESASGYGKNTYSIRGPNVTRPIDVSVEVSSVNNDIAKKSVVVKPKDPVLLFYKKDPIYGIEFQKTLSQTQDLKEKEISVVGIPYFFGTLEATSQDLSYKWTINNTQTQTPSYQNFETFRIKEGTSGISNITLSVKNAGEFLQSGKNSFQIKFGD